MALLLITIVFIFLYALLILYYRKGWLAVTQYKPVAKEISSLLISVLVPARNEEQKIGILLAALSGQSLPPENYEVIVIDDYSTDDTAAEVKKSNLPNLKLIQPAAGSQYSSKKKAIEAGVHQAKGVLIVTTDADCVPSPNWLQTISDFYIEKGAAFIAAPVKFFHDNSWLQYFQALDFMTLQGITAASVGSGFHTMCNGANLAYEKKSFLDVNGFDGIDKVATGDDMLLMYKIWKKEPGRVHYLKSTDAIVQTSPMPGFKEFIMQRKRWASKTLVYDDHRIIAVLGFVYLFNFLFLVLILMAIIHPVYWWLVAGYWISKTLVEYLFVFEVARFYREEKLMRYFFLFQPLHIFYTVFIGLISQLGQYEWKGRKTK